MPSVYQVEIASNDYQSLELEYGKWPAYDAAWETDYGFFEGTAIGDRWEPPDVFVRMPLLKVPDIWPGPGPTFSLDEKALKILGAIVEECGELLPVSFESRVLQAVNITSIIDCIDLKLSDYDELTHWFHKYAFREDCLQTTLFKIPQTAAASVLTVEGLGDPAHEFKPLVEKHGLTGLRFRPLWSSDGA